MVLSNVASADGRNGMFAATAKSRARPPAARYRTSAKLYADAYSCDVVLAVVLAVFAAPRVDELRDDCHLRCCLLSSDVGTLLCRHRLSVVTYFAGKWFRE